MNIQDSIKLYILITVMVLFTSCKDDDQIVPMRASLCNNHIEVSLVDKSTKDTQNIINIYDCLLRKDIPFQEESIKSDSKSILISFNASLPDEKSMNFISPTKAIGTSVTKFSIDDISILLNCTYTFSIANPNNLGSNSISISKIECNGKQINFKIKEDGTTVVFELIYDGKLLYF